MRKKQATINARIPTALRRKVDEQAARQGLKPSRILQTALEEYLARRADERKRSERQRAEGAQIHPFLQSAAENATTIEIVKEGT